MFRGDEERYEKKRNLFLKGASMLATVFVAFSSWYSWPIVQDFYEVRSGVKILKKSKIPEFEIDNEVERVDVKEYLCSFLNDPQMTQSIIVTGARGVGKTIAVKSALKDIVRVLYINETVSLLDFGQALAKKLGATKDNRTLYFVREVLLKAKNSNIIPTMVIEVDHKWSTADVQSLLHWCKRISGDDRLAKIVVVISSAINSHNFTVRISELRGFVLNLKECNDAEAMKYFKNFFSSYKMKKDELLTDSVVEVPISVCRFQSTTYKSSINRHFKFCITT